MLDRMTRTAAGEAATAIVLDTFRLNGLLLTAGNRIAAAEGLTAARWQVLGAVALAGRPLTVPQIARRMGLTRQAVQASVNRLLAEGLAEGGDNLDHRRSPLIGLTELGRARYAAVDQRQARWVSELAAGLTRSELGTAAHVLGELCTRLEAARGQPHDQKADDHEP